jgi:preprotein translocase subunit SecY
MRDGICCRTARFEDEFRRARQGRRTQEADLVHAGCAGGLPARDLYPAARHQPDAVADLFKQAQSGILGLFNMFSGGAVGRLAIFALNIMPYISASIIIQLLTSVVPTLEALKKEGESGRKVINQYTRYLTLVLALFQAWGIAVGLQGSGNLVQDPGPSLWCPP